MAYLLIKQRLNTTNLILCSFSWEQCITTPIMVTFCLVLLEKVSGMTYGDYLKKNIFDIAGMRETLIAGTQENTDNMLASGYAKDSLGFVNIDIYADLFAQIIFSAGNIISTTEDLNKWYKALFSGQIISKDLLEKAHTPYLKNAKNQPKGYPFIPYGYGWIIDTSLGVDKKIIWHNGILDGFLSNMRFQPSSSTLVVLLSNFNYPHVCIGINGSKHSITMIDYLPSILFNYATGVIKHPVSINILPDSECKKPKERQRRRRDIKHFEGIEGLIHFDTDLGEFIPMSEILKEIKK